MAIGISRLLITVFTARWGSTTLGVNGVGACVYTYRAPASQIARTAHVATPFSTHRYSFMDILLMFWRKTQIAFPSLSGDETFCGQMECQAAMKNWRNNRFKGSNRF